MYSTVAMSNNSVCYEYETAEPILFLAPCFTVVVKFYQLLTQNSFRGYNVQNLIDASLITLPSQKEECLGDKNVQVMSSLRALSLPNFS